MSPYVPPSTRIVNSRSEPCGRMTIRSDDRLGGLGDAVRGDDVAERVGELAEALRG